MQKNQPNIFPDATMEKIKRESYEHKVIQDEKLINIIKNVIEKNPDLSEHAYAHSFLSQIFSEYYEMNRINKFTANKKYYDLVDKILIIYNHEETKDIFNINDKKVILDENELREALNDYKQAA